MDPNDPSQFPHGANFLPQLSPISAEPAGIDPFSEDLEEFTTYLTINNNRKLLTSHCR